MLGNTCHRMAAHKKDKHPSSNADKKTTALTRNKVKQTTSKKAAESWVKSSRNVLVWRMTIVALAAAVGVLHNYHVSTIFENDRHFSHLSTLEREMTFRSEMGMYYSYYKTVVQASSFFEGMYEITHNNITEYPLVINTLERFNLLPEVFVGGLYRIFDWLCNWCGVVRKQCWQVNRGKGLSPVDSCEGLQQPEYFYLESVWMSAGLTACVLFLYGVLLSESIAGGLLAIICFFFNHGECTRVQWSPPLRESFAYPFCLLQMLSVSSCLYMNRETTDSTVPNRQHKVQVSLLTVTTALCLTLWQFSQFFLATQVIAILIMFSLNCISRFSALVILVGQVFGVTQTLFLMFGNELLLTSLLTCLLLSSVFTLFFLYPVFMKNGHNLFRGILCMVIIMAITIVLKTRAFTTNHDTHIINILKAKLTDYKDFHTLLYTCYAEFDFLGWEPIKKLTSSWLLPSAIAVIIIFAIHWYFSNEKSKVIDPHIVYNLLQLGAFTVMAVMIMRLKLFFTPHLCLTASLLGSRKYMKKLGPPEIHFSLLVLLIGGMSVTGISNIMDQHRILGEFSDVALEEALMWIQKNTPKTAVFAGPMPLTAAILLSTRRPVVNHPHYENAHLRERTKKVYSAFSRKPAEEVFKIISTLEVDYLILPYYWCIQSSGRQGCRMVDLWDVEDPENKERPPICPQLFERSAFPFHKVFASEQFVILRLQPPYIELKGFNKY